MADCSTPGTGDTHLHTCEFDPRTLALKLNATIPGETGAIHPVVEKIMAVIGEMGCVKDQEFEIRLALSEALANAVLHGCQNDPAKKVNICVECDPERGMLVVVRDPGSGFDPAEVPSPIEGEQIYRGGGRGVYLINQLMDEVEYHRGGTEIRMIKRDAVPAGEARSEE
jgi:serine/threonine-protein kinase RsbW